MGTRNGGSIGANRNFVGIVFVAGALALAVNWSERDHWLYFLPTYVTWAVGLMLALIGFKIISGTGIATYVLFCVGFPFLIGYLRNRLNWGLLIPAYVLFSVGFMVSLIGMGLLKNLLIPAYVMFCIAIPFLVVYFQNRDHWWALIPSGIMMVIGISFLLATPSARFLAPLF